MLGNALKQANLRLNSRGLRRRYAYLRPHISCRQPVKSSRLGRLIREDTVIYISAASSIFIGSGESRLSVSASRNSV